MKNITTAAANSLAEIIVMRLTGLTAMNLMTLAQVANDSFTVLKTLGVEELVIDDQRNTVHVLYNQAMDKLQDAILSAVSMNTHFVRSATVIDDGYTKTVVVTLHRD